MSPSDAEKNMSTYRPFNSIWAECGFIFSVAFSQFIQEFMLSGFIALVPNLQRAFDMSINTATWSTSVLSLAICSFLLTFGRLSDMYGGLLIYIAGATWLMIWSLIAGFSTSQVMLIVCRAMQGLGCAAILPASLGLLGSIYHPGPRKNLVFAIYGAMAPLGVYIGILVSGLVLEFASWRWYFWISSILVSVSIAICWLTVPKRQRKDSTARMDWLGTLTLSTGLILLVFTVTDGAHAGTSPYIFVTAATAIVMLAAAFYVQGRVASQPLVPFSVFRIPFMRPLMLGLLVCYGTVGIYTLYATLYIRNVMLVGPLLLVAYFTPMAIGGAVLAVVGGLVMHSIPGTAILIVSGLASIVSSLLFVLAPHDAGYWQWVLPSMVCATVAIDLIFTVANVFLSTTLPRNQQGLAAALANLLLQLGIALWLGAADIVVSSTSEQGLASSYTNAFWLNVGLGAAASLVFAAWVRIGRAKAEGTGEGPSEGNTEIAAEAKVENG